MADTMNGNWYHRLTKDNTPKWSSALQRNNVNNKRRKQADQIDQLIKKRDAIGLKEHEKEKLRFLQLLRSEWLKEAREVERGNIPHYKDLC
jgi:hypothetical protein